MNSHRKNTVNCDVKKQPSLRSLDHWVTDTPGFPGSIVAPIFSNTDVLVLLLSVPTLQAKTRDN